MFGNGKQGGPLPRKKRDPLMEAHKEMQDTLLALVARHGRGETNSSDDNTDSRGQLANGEEHEEATDPGELAEGAEHNINSRDKEDGLDEDGDGTDVTMDPTSAVGRLLKERAAPDHGHGLILYRKDSDVKPSPGAMDMEETDREPGHGDRKSSMARHLKRGR